MGKSLFTKTEESSSKFRQKAKLSLRFEMLMITTLIAMNLDVYSDSPSVALATSCCLLQFQSFTSGDLKSSHRDQPPWTRAALDWRDPALQTGRLE